MFIGKMMSHDWLEKDQQELVIIASPTNNLNTVNVMVVTCDGIVVLIYFVRTKIA